MRPTIAGLALLLLAGADALAQQEPKKQDPNQPAEHRLPFNPFAEASEGDWMVFQVVTPGTAFVINTVHCKVTKVAGDETTLLSTPLDAGSSDVDESEEQTFSRKEAPDLVRYVFGGATQVDLADVKTSDDTRQLSDGKKLECKLLTFTVPHPEEAGSRVEVKVWISPQVKGNGMVAVELKGGELSSEIKLLGWGTAKETTWGKTADQVKAERKAAEEPPKKE